MNGEIARAKRRAELQDAINKGTAPANSTPTVKNADPGASALATYLATLGVDISAARLADWLVLVPVLALELGAALSILLVQAVCGAPASGHARAPVVEQTLDSRTEGRPAQPQPSPVTPLDSKTPATKPQTVSKPKPAKRAARRRLGQQTVVSKAEAEGKVVDMLKAKGSLDSASVRGVARLIGARKSTAHNAIVALVTAGVVAKVGSSLVLAAASAGCDVVG